METSNTWELVRVQDGRGEEWLTTFHIKCFDHDLHAEVLRGEYKHYHGTKRTKHVSFVNRPDEGPVCLRCEEMMPDSVRFALKLAF